MNNPIVSQHTSWISLDPIQGCTANCSYCYLHPLNLTNVRPQPVSSVTEAVIYDNLMNSRFFDKRKIEHGPAIPKIPIAIGNYTDMCMTHENQQALLRLLRVHKRVLPDVPVCILTKAHLNRRFLAEINELGITVIFFVSLAFLSPEFEKGTPTVAARLKNFELLSDFDNIKAIHWWRPITSINCPDIKAVEEQIRLLKSAGSLVSVAVGLKYGKKMEIFLSDKDNPLNAYYTRLRNVDSDEHVIFESELREFVTLSSVSENYSIFWGTSCAISYILQQRCYNARFRKLLRSGSCSHAICAMSQVDRCGNFALEFPAPSSALLGDIANFLNIKRELVTYSSEIEAVIVNHQLTQEEQSYLTQASSFPVVAIELTANLVWQEAWRTLK
jgi:DNA repair photolyase